MRQARVSGNPIYPENFRELLSQAGWFATYLASSRLHIHRQKALLFAALCKQLFPDDRVLEAVCYTVFTRTGTLPAAMHLDFVAGEHNEFIGPSLGPLNLEFSAAFNEFFSPLGGGSTLTEFQRRVELALEQRDVGVISGPTSAGKSYIVHEHVKLLIKSGAFVGLFIVPTKALIAQVCALYRQFRTQNQLDLAVISSVTDDMVRPPGSVVMALTQERCVRLLGTPIAKEIGFVFADEIQTLESGDRGALLEYVLHSLTKIVPSAKFFAAGPFIGNGAELGTTVFDRPCEPLATEDSPVSQMIIKIAPVREQKHVVLTVLGETSDRDTTLKMPVPRVMFSRWRGNQGTAVADVLNMLPKGGTTIVYAPGQATARNWAEKYVETVSDQVQPTQEIGELCEFISESIHPQCSLITFLKRRVAYHHAALPDFVREEIEGLFSEQSIDVLFCTSTLLEGVNLPAEKVLVLTPEKGDDPLTRFEFRNLIGRAGRLDQHLCGLAYCICIPDESQKEWIDDYREHGTKEVLPTVQSRLTSDFEKISQILEEGTPVTSLTVPQGLRGSVVILRSRFLQSPGDVARYLKGKLLTESAQNQILRALETGSKVITIPRALALLNPYVDPVLQSRLFEKVSLNPTAWRIRRDSGRATDLGRVFKLLDEIFSIMDEIAPIGNRSIYRDHLLRIARMWLEGKPFRDIVTRVLPSNRRDAADITSDEADEAISRAMEIISKEVGYVTAKYFSVLSEILTYVTTSRTDRNDFAFAISLPGMLELGCSDRTSLALVTACIPRAAAIKVGPLIPVATDDPVGWLSQNESAVRPKLTPIYVKILQRLGIWPADAIPATPELTG